MKELKNKPEETKEPSLYEQAMRAKPRFDSKEEAIEFYTNKLNALASKRVTTVPKILTEAETSPVFDEDFLEARNLWNSLSSVKALSK